MLKVIPIIFSNHPYCCVPQSDPCVQSTWLRAIPGCWLPFHWPRLDKEQLLSICLRDVPGCYWSGGFQIEKIDSFYLNIRWVSPHSD